MLRRDNVIYYHLAKLHSSNTLNSDDSVFQLCNRLAMYTRMKLLLLMASSFEGNERQSYGYQKISVYVYFMTRFVFVYCFKVTILRETPLRIATGGCRIMCGMF